MASMEVTLRVLAYRLSGGRLSDPATLLLTTSGRKSGKPRTVPLRFVRDGNDFVVVGSNLGRPANPAWYLNLQAQPRAAIRLGRVRQPVVARTVPIQERQRLWEMLVALDPGYEQMMDRTTRILPIVRLSSGAE